MYLNAADPVPRSLIPMPKGFALTPTKSGFMMLTTPTGAEVLLTKEEEKELAKDALRENLKMNMTAWERRKDTVISSGMNAAGYAVGFGLAGLALAAVLRWVGANKKDIPKMTPGG